MTKTDFSRVAEFAFNVPSLSVHHPQVFRFDQSIAHVANSLVGPLKGETRPLLGCAGKQGEVSDAALSL